MRRTTKIILLTSYGLWGGLGAYRGVQDYNKKYNDKYKYYLKHQNDKYKYDHIKKPQYYYLSCCGSSIIWAFGFYLNPLFIAISIMDELYNVERSIRGIKDDEEND
jgi:hypothetical protein